MAVFVESGVHVDLSGKLYFRFQDLTAYRRVSCQHVQEMDFCWMDGEELILLELKNYSKEVDHAKAEQTTATRFLDYLIERTTPKVWDSLLMLSACWLGTEKGYEFRTELPSVFHTRAKKIHVVIVLGVPDKFKPQFGRLRDRFRDVLQGKMALFDSKSLIVCMPDHLHRIPLLACLQPTVSSH